MRSPSPTSKAWTKEAVRSTIEHNADDNSDNDTITSDNDAVDARAAPPKHRSASECEKHARAFLSPRHTAALHALKACHDAEVRRLGRQLRVAGLAELQRIAADDRADDGFEVGSGKIGGLWAVVLDWRVVAVHVPVAVMVVFLLAAYLSRLESREFLQTGRGSWA